VASAQSLRPRLAAGQALSAGAQAADPAAVPAEAAEALLLWHDPWASAKAFGGGLYALICLRHLAFGARRRQRPERRQRRSPA